MDNYKRISTQKDQFIGTWEICSPRSKPQSQEEENDPFGYRYSTIYRVESRHEFDNCKVDAAHKLFTTGCLDLPINSLKPLNTAKIPVCYFLDDSEEEKNEYYFLSVAFDRLSDRVDGVCNDSVLRFSIFIDSNVDRFGYLKVVDYKQSNLSRMTSLMGHFITVLCVLFFLYKVFDFVFSTFGKTQNRI